MSLTKKDIKSIANIVNTNGEHLDKKWEKRREKDLRSIAEVVNANGEQLDKKWKRRLDENRKATGETINASIEYIDIKWEKKFTTIINKLSEHDVRFDNLEAKLNQLIKTEHEDIMVTYKDIENIKLRLKKADI